MEDKTLIDREELENKIKLCVNDIVQSLTWEDMLGIKRLYEFPIDDKQEMMIRVQLYKS